MIGDGYSVDRSLCTDCGLGKHEFEIWLVVVMPRGRIQKFILPRRVYQPAYHPPYHSYLDSWTSACMMTAVISANARNALS